jgi:hypothetical protein
MKTSTDPLVMLLALKREERPNDGYWRDFLCEFHQRQREQASRKWSAGGIWERVAACFADLGPAKWAYGAGLAYAAVTVAFFLVPSGVDVEKTPAIPVNHQMIPAPVTPPTAQQPKHMDSSPATQGTSGTQTF